MSSRKQLRCFLVFRARDERVRVVTRNPQLDWDEVAFTVQVNVPDPWGRLAGAIVIDLPENGPAVIEVSGEGVTASQQAVTR